MKKIPLIILALLLSNIIVNGQATCPAGINENFDGGAPTYISSGAPGWSVNNTYSTSGTNCIRGQFNNASATEYTSAPAVSTLGATTVVLKFKHICKLNPVDGGIIEINTGLGWVQLRTAPSPSANCVYTGTATTFTQAFGWKFNALSYPLLWLPAQDAAAPNNSWWKQESFDISIAAANQASVEVRFKAADGDVNGMVGNYGWLIDDIEFCFSSCELDASTITPVPPILSGPIFTPGPFTVCFDIFDSSGVAAADLNASINGGPFNSIGGLQQITALQWCGTIPVTLNDGDTICWNVQVFDASCNFNLTNYPPSGSACAVYSSSVVPPYCDNFDNASSFWTDSSAGGSHWQNGTPAFGFTNSPLSFPNSWDIDLTTGYLNNTNCFLTSGSIDFTNALNPKLDFWLNYNTEVNADGARLQYSTNGGGIWSTLGTINDPCGTEWYNSTITGGPGWSGLSNGWTPSSYKIVCGASAIAGAGDVKFRFVFRSSGTTTLDGFSIDNFCIKLPAEDDFGVFAITSPGGGVPAGNSVPINVIIENYGNATQTAANIITTINGVIINTFPWTGSIAPGSQATVVLPNFTVPTGTFTLCVYTVLPGDTTHINDTSCVNLLGIPNFPLPFSDNFDGAVNWYAEADPTSTSNWELGTPNFGLTTGALSAPNAWDIDLVSGYTSNALCYLYSPYFNFFGVVNPQLSFWQNFETQEVNDGVTLQYTVNNGGSWNTLGVANDPNGLNWYKTASITASGLPGWSGVSGGWKKSAYDLINVGAITNQPSVQFRFIFASDAFTTADGHSIDDFAITKPDSNDLGVFAIVNPTGATIANGIDTVTVTLKNYGTQPQITTPVYYKAGTNPTAGPFTWTGVLNPGQKINYQIPVPFTSPQGDYDLCAWTKLPGDANTSNDTSCSSNIGVPIITLTPPGFLDDFENANLNGWSDSTAGPGTSWQYGTPNWQDITIAHSPVNGWMTNINTGYQDNAECYLLSPFFDFSAVDSVRLSFWQKLIVDRAFGDNDGTRLEYTVDNGVNWNVLGTLADANGINWYNSASIDFNLLPGWTGSSQSPVDFPGNNNIDGWMQSKYELLSTGYGLSGLNNQPKPVRFRYVFTSNGFTNASTSAAVSGHAIDDFKLRLPCAADLSLESIVNPVSGPAGITVIPQVIIKNDGIGTPTTFNIVYCVTPFGGATTCVTHTWTGILPPTATIQPFLPPLTLPAGQFDFCVHVDLANDCDHSNDSLCITLVGIPTYHPDYQNSFSDNFDGPNLGWTTTNGPTNNSANNWQWGIPNYGLTNSAHSAPKVWDINLNTPYVGPAVNFLYTPFFDFSVAGPTGDPELTFWHNFFTEDTWDGVTVEYCFNNNNVWTVLGSVNDVVCGNGWYSENLNTNNLDGWAGNSNGWIKAYYQLKCVSGMNGAPIVQFRFRFAADGIIQEDGYSIDDFGIKIPIPISILTDTVWATNKNALIFPNDQVSFSTIITNEGSTSISFATVSLYVDNNLISQDLVDFTTIAPFGAIKRDSSRSYTFLNSWIAEPGEHSVCVITSLPNGQTDLNTSNDTFCINVVVFANQASYPYCNSFESGTKWVTANAVLYNNNDYTTWEIGTPSETILNSAHTGSKCWTLDANGNYHEGDSSGLFSPLMSVSVFKCYKISYWQQFHTEQYQDGGSLSFSLDSGDTWLPISFQNTPFATFFNYNNIAALGYDNGFTGNSFGWRYIEKTIRPNVNDQLILRWRFAADLDSTMEGWSIDDFCFEDLGFCNAIGIDELTATGLGLGQNYPNPFNGHTTIEYQIPVNGKVQLIFSDAMGRMIRMFNNAEANAGSYTVDFNSNELKPGIYFYTLIFNGERITKRMVVTD